MWAAAKQWNLWKNPNCVYHIKKNKNTDKI